MEEKQLISANGSMCHGVFLQLSCSVTLEKKKTLFGAWTIFSRAAAKEKGKKKKGATEQLSHNQNPVLKWSTQNHASRTKKAAAISG